MSLLYVTLILLTLSVSIFPYTTLFRSLDGEDARPATAPRGDGARSCPARRGRRARRRTRRRRRRSEEHTSELQSRVELVCRLLLEKKNQEGYEPIWVIAFPLLSVAFAW